MQVYPSTTVGATRLKCRMCDHAVAPPGAPGETTSCAQCGATVVNRDGVIDFLPGDAGEGRAPGAAAMQRLNQVASERGWFAALLQQCYDAPHKIALISDPARLGWLFHCYDVRAHDVCLCVGSDWGSLVFPVSRFFKTVYSLDDDLEKLRFQAIRAAQENVDNLCILRAPLLRFPLANRSVDLVLVSGVLDWIGRTDFSRPPAEVHEALLHEVRRVLKPGGQLYLDGENRLGASRGLGATGQSRMLIPRFRLPGWRGGKDIEPLNRPSNSDRTTRVGNATYSVWGYEKLLRRTGFSHASVYWAWPSFSHPRMSGPLDGGSVRYMVDRMAHQSPTRPVRLLAHLALRLPDRMLSLLIRLVSPQFLIVAGQQPNKHTLETQIVNRTPPPHSFVRLTMGVNVEVKTTYLLMNRASEIYKVVRVVETPGCDGVQSTFATQEAEGIRGRPLHPYLKKDVRAAGRWLADFHQRTQCGVWSHSRLLDEMGALVETTGALLDDARNIALLRAFEQRYRQTIQSLSLPMTGEHGDYTIPNVLMLRDGGNRNRMLRVVDWEFQRDQGNPLMDVGAFLLSLLRSQMRTHRFPAQIRPNTSLSWFLTAYDTGGGAPFHLAPGYYLLRVLDRVQRQAASPALSHLILGQWRPLLRPALDFGVNAIDTT